jgi:S1-C subfamily serine protease
MRTYHITARQLVILALATSIFAATVVVFYDRVASPLLGRLVGARDGEQAQRVAAGTPSGISDPSTVSDERNNQEVYEVISPSVVNITSTTVVRDWFSEYPQEGTGSGSIIDKEGHILTNFHVVQEADKLDVALANDHHYPAVLVGADPDNDLAVIKITAPRESLRPIPMGTSQTLFVGEKVLAIGNPFGLDRTLTRGIISGLSRPVRSENGKLIDGVVQTDASINPGNSGGPLLDSKGRMIGINTMIYSPTGGSVGIGFAVPVDTAKQSVPDIMAYGRVRRPRLGIVPYELDARLADALKLPVKQGLMVLQVVEGGAADEAGIRGGTQPAQVGRYVIYLGGDVITRVAGQPVTSPDDLDRILKEKKIGDTVEVEVVRSQRKMTFTVRLAEQPGAARRRS